MPRLAPTEKFPGLPPEKPNPPPFNVRKLETSVAGLPVPKTESGAEVVLRFPTIAPPFTIHWPTALLVLFRVILPPPLLITVEPLNLHVILTAFEALLLLAPAT